MALKQKHAAEILEQPADIMVRLLLEPIEVTIGNSTRRVTALEAIMMQLFQQQMSGNAKAHALLARFRPFLPQRESVEIEFEASNAGS